MHVLQKLPVAGHYEKSLAQYSLLSADSLASQQFKHLKIVWNPTKRSTTFFLLFFFQHALYFHINLLMAFHAACYCCLPGTWKIACCCWISMLYVIHKLIHHKSNHSSNHWIQKKDPNIPQNHHCIYHIWSNEDSLKNCSISRKTWYQVNKKVDGYDYCTNFILLHLQSSCHSLNVKVAYYDMYKYTHWITEIWYWSFHPHCAP